jgi:hypothetical protein
VGVLIGVLFAIKYWRVVLGLLAAVIITAVILGVHQLMSAAEQPATSVPEHSQIGGTPR